MAGLGFPNDIAVIQPETPLVFNDFVHSLPIHDGLARIPKKCRLVGWGITGQCY